MNGVVDAGAKDFHTRNSWRRWLGKNRERDDGLWVLIRKVNGDNRGIYYKDAVEEALCAGWIDGKMKSLDSDTYKLWFSPRRPGSLWSKLNRDRAVVLIKAGLMLAPGLAAIEEAKNNGMWQAAYTSRTPPEIPTDLKIALKRDPEAWTNFSGFANSYKHQYAGWVAQAKRPQTRKRRIGVVVERAKKNEKPGINM